MHSRLLCLALICLLSTPANAQEVTEQHKPDTYLGLRIAGIASFTSLYLTSVLNAALTAAFLRFDGSPVNGLFIPIVGPWVAALNPANRNVVNVTFLALDGVGQLAGATLFVLSLVLSRAEAAHSAWQLVPGPGSLALNVRF